MNNKARHNRIDAKYRWRSDWPEGAGSNSEPLGQTKVMQIRQRETHCKPKPCKAYRELPVSQFPQRKTCFHYREPLFPLQGPCFHYRDFPVNPCTRDCSALNHQGAITHEVCCLAAQFWEVFFLGENPLISPLFAPAVV
jgi:hypothetical protein